MTRVYFHMPLEVAAAGENGGLGLEGTGGLCLPCMMFAKGDQVQATADRWGPAVNDRQDDKQKWIEFDSPALGNPPIRAACVLGVSDIPGMPPGVLVPVCWDHLGAIQRLKPVDAQQPDEAPGRPGVLPVTVALPPGFGNGHGKPRRRP